MKKYQRPPTREHLLRVEQLSDDVHCLRCGEAVEGGMYVDQVPVVGGMFNYGYVHRHQQDCRVSFLRHRLDLPIDLRPPVSYLREIGRALAETGRELRDMRRG